MVNSCSNSLTDYYSIPLGCDKYRKSGWGIEEDGTWCNNIASHERSAWIRKGKAHMVGYANIMVKWDVSGAEAIQVFEWLRPSQAQTLWTVHSREAMESAGAEGA
jgi:hypothetical protein